MGGSRESMSADPGSFEVRVAQQGSFALAPGLAASRSAQHKCAVQLNVGAFSKIRMLPGACPPLQQLGRLAKFAGSPPKLGGNESLPTRELSRRGSRDVHDGGLLPNCRPSNARRHR
jgi:hypothetical protein